MRIRLPMVQSFSHGFGQAVRSEGLLEEGSCELRIWAADMKAICISECDDRMRSANSVRACQPGSDQGVQDDPRFTLGALQGLRRIAGFNTCSRDRGVRLPQTFVHYPVVDEQDGSSPPLFTVRVSSRTGADAGSGSARGRRIRKVVRAPVAFHPDVTAAVCTMP